MSTRYVALLRGINVGGKNKLPMKDLIPLFARAGCEEATSAAISGEMLIASALEAYQLFRVRDVPFTSPKQTNPTGKEPSCQCGPDQRVNEKAPQGAWPSP